MHCQKVKKRRFLRLSPEKYLVLSIVAWTIMVFCSLRYYLLSSIYISELDLAISYKVVVAFYMNVAACLVFLGALITMRFPSMKNLFSNVALPPAIFMIFRTAEKNLIITCIIVMFILSLFVFMVVSYWKRSKRTFLEKIMILNLKLRPRLLFLLMISIVPWALWIVHSEKSEGYCVLTADAVENLKDENANSEDDYDCLVGLNDKIWKKYSLLKKYKVIQTISDYECERLGVAPAKVQVRKLMTDTILGFYSDGQDLITISLLHLKYGSLEDVMDSLTHECRHRYQYLLISCVDILEKEGIAVNEISYFATACKLRKACDEYVKDAKKWDTYSKNEMEIDARSYSKKEVLHLKKQFRWT